MNDADSYAWFHDVRVGPGDFDELDHIGNAAVARMLDDARTDRFRSLEGRQPGRHVVVRHVSISYDARDAGGYLFVVASRPCRAPGGAS